MLAQPGSDENKETPHDEHHHEDHASDRFARPRIDHSTGCGAKLPQFDSLTVRDTALRLELTEICREPGYRAVGERNRLLRGRRLGIDIDRREQGILVEPEDIARG